MIKEAAPPSEGTKQSICLNAQSISFQLNFSLHKFQPRLNIHFPSSRRRGPWVLLTIEKIPFISLHQIVDCESSSVLDVFQFNSLLSKTAIFLINFPSRFSFLEIFLLRFSSKLPTGTKASGKKVCFLRIRGSWQIWSADTFFNPQRNILHRH